MCSCCKLSNSISKLLSFHAETTTSKNERETLSFVIVNEAFALRICIDKQHNWKFLGGSLTINQLEYYFKKYWHSCS